MKQKIESRLKLIDDIPRAFKCVFQTLLNKQNSKVLCTFAPNRSFGQLLDISIQNFIFSKTFDSEFSYVEVLLTDQNSKPLKVEDKVNITLV